MEKVRIEYFEDFGNGWGIFEGTVLSTDAYLRFYCNTKDVSKSLGIPFDKSLVEKLVEVEFEEDPDWDDRDNEEAGIDGQVDLVYPMVQGKLPLISISTVS